MDKQTSKKISHHIFQILGCGQWINQFIKNLVLLIWCGIQSLILYYLKHVLGLFS